MAFATTNFAHADIIYNTFGTGDPSFHTNWGWTLGTVGPDYEISMGNAFTPTQNYQLTSVEAALTYFSGTNSMNLVLMNSTGTGQPASVLETFSLTNLANAWQNNNYVLTASSTPGIDLLKGNQYWLFAEPTDPTTFAMWNMSLSSKGSIIDNDYASDYNVVQPNNLQGAFQIDGTLLSSANDRISAVPEPVSLFLFTTGLAGVFLRKRRA